MKIAVVGSRSLLKQELCKELVNQEIRFQIDTTAEAIVDRSYDAQECDFQDIVACEHFLSDIDCVIHTGLSWRGLKQEEVYSQIDNLGCIVNEAINKGIKIIFISDALSTGYHSKSETYDESKLWNQSIDWSLPGFMYHFAEREVFRGIIEGIEAVIVRPSFMIGSESDAQAVSRLLKARINSKSSEGILSIVSRTDILLLISKLIAHDSFEHRFVNCSGHSLPESQFAELIRDQDSPEPRSSFLSSALNYFKKTAPSAILNRPLGLNINYDNQRSIDWLGIEYQDLKTTMAEFQ